MSRCGASVSPDMTPTNGGMINQDPTRLPCYYHEPGANAEVFLRGSWRRVKLLQRLLKERCWLVREWKEEHKIALKDVYPFQEDLEVYNFDVGQDVEYNVKGHFLPDNCKQDKKKECHQVTPAKLISREELSNQRKAWKIKLLCDSSEITVPLESLRRPRGYGES